MSEKNKEMQDNGKLREEGEATIGEAKEIKDEKKSVSKASPSVVTTSENSKLQLMSKEDLQTLDYSNFATPARMLALGEVLVRSKLVTKKTVEDVMVSLMCGKELGIPLVTSLSQIHAIDGKPSLGVHVIRGIILREKILSNKLEDFVPIYQFVETDEKGVVKLENNLPIVLGIGTLEEQPENSKKRPIDTRTTYEFIRMIKMPNGEWREQKVKSSFTISDAKAAELLDKTNWKRYPKRMLDARAYAIGAREIADDFLNGIYTPDELGANSFIDDNGREIVEDIPHEVIN